MSSRVFAGLDSAIAVVSKLMKLSDYSLLQNQLFELHNLLVEHRKLVASEELNFKKKCLLLESDKELANAEKLGMEEELRKSKKECQGLRKELLRLRKEEEMWSDKVKKVEGQYSKYYAEIFAELSKKKDEVEELVKDRDSVREECFMLQGENASVGIEKLRVEDELKWSRDECHRLEESLSVMLSGEESASSERVKWEQEKYAKFEEEQLEIMKKKDKVIAELSSKVSDMEWREKVRKDEIKQDCLLLKSTNAGLKLDKLKYGDELKKCQEQCRDLQRKLARLTEDERVSRDKVKRAESIFSKLYDEQSKANEDLQQRLRDVEDQRLRSDQTLEEMRGKQLKDDQALQETRRLNDLLSGFNKDLQKQIEDFEADKLVSHQTIEKMWSEQLEAVRMMEEMRGKQLEDDRTVKELRKQNLAACDVIENLQKQISALEADRLVSHQTMEKLRSEHGDANRIIAEMMGKQLEGNRAVQELRKQNMVASDRIEELKKKISAFEADGLVADQTIEEMRHEQRDRLVPDQTIKEIKCEQLEADRSTYGRTKEKMRRQQLEADMEKLRSRNVEASVVLEKLRNRLLAFESKKLISDKMLKEIKLEKLAADQTIEKLRSQILDSSDIINGLRSRIQAFEAATNHNDQVKRKGSGSKEDPVVFLDGADGERCGQSAYNSDLSAILGQKRKSQELGLTFILRRKIVSSTNGDNNLPNYRQQEEQIQIPTEERDTSSHDSSGRPSPRLTGLGTRKLHKTWMSRADMLKDFREDSEVCMYAVCVLYRHKLSEPELSPSGPIGEFAHFEAMGGCALAKYLIDGDPHHRLSKSVFEVKQERPNFLDKCRVIAVDYSEKLFSIYCSGMDLFFKST